MNQRIPGLAAAERRRFAELLARLDDSQWQAPSLCAGWTVRDVARHTVTFLDQPVPALAAGMVTCRGDADRLNRALLRAEPDCGTADLATRMRTAVPNGAGRLYRHRVTLLESVIHCQDVAVPLGLPVSPADEAVTAAVRYAYRNPVVGARHRIRGIRLVADDLGWEIGRGEPLRGPGLQLLLAMTGRTAVTAAQLRGPGLALLLSR